MYVNWKQVLIDNPHFRETEFWHIDLGSLEEERHRVARRNRIICFEMLDGAVGKIVAYKYGVSPSFVSYLMRRCFSKDESGNYFLGRALVPGKRLFKSKRQISRSAEKQNSTYQYRQASRLEESPTTQVAIPTSRTPSIDDQSFTTILTSLLTTRIVGCVTDARVNRMRLTVDYDMRTGCILSYDVAFEHAVPNADTEIPSCP